MTLTRYAASLPTAGTPGQGWPPTPPDGSGKRKSRKPQDTGRGGQGRVILKVKQGQYISRDDVYQELAARAVALSASLKTEFEARSLDVIALVEGNPKKSGPFVEHVEQVIDEAMNEYAKPVEIEVTFTAEQEADAESDDE